MSRVWLLAVVLLSLWCSAHSVGVRQRTGIRLQAGSDASSLDAALNALRTSDSMRHSVSAAAHQQSVQQALAAVDSELANTVQSLTPVVAGAAAAFNGADDMSSLDAVDAALDRETAELEAQIGLDLQNSEERRSATAAARAQDEMRFASARGRTRARDEPVSANVTNFPLPAGPAPFPADQPMAEPVVNGNDIVAANPKLKPIHKENNNAVVDIKEIETHDDLPPVSLHLFLGNKTIARMEPTACVLPGCNPANITTKELKDPIIPRITRVRPLSQDPTIRIINPKLLITPLIEGPPTQCHGKCPPPMPAPKAEPLPLAPPLYDPLKVAQLHLAKAQDKLSDVGWVVNALKEPRNPSEHLIQQTIANIHKIEAKDLGPLAPGDQLQFEHKIKIEDAFMLSNADKAHVDAKSEELLGPGNVVTPNLDHLGWPQRMLKLFEDYRAVEIKRERQRILALQGRALPGDSGDLSLKHALFGDINSSEQRIKDRERKRPLGGKLESTLAEESEAAKQDEQAAGESSEESSRAVLLELESNEVKNSGSSSLSPSVSPSKALSKVLYDGLENSAKENSESVAAGTTPSVPARVAENSEVSEESSNFNPALNITAIQRLRKSSQGQVDSLRAHMDRLKALMDDRTAKEDVQALRGPQKIIVARALEKLGEAVDLLAGRIKDLDSMEMNMFNKLFGKGHNGPAGTDEKRMIQERAQAVKERKESEIAQLIRNEVRILTNQMRTELLMLKGAFFSSMRDLLYALRKDLQDNYMRSRENDKKLLAIAMGQMPNGTARLIDVLALKPVEEKEALSRAIAHKIAKAFNSAQNLEKQVQSARSSQAVKQEMLDRAQESFDNEPSRKELDAAISLEASKHRSRADVTKDAEEHMLQKKGLMAKLLSDATAKALRKQLMEDPDHGADKLFEDDSDKHPLVKQAARIAKEREKKNTARSKSDGEKINSLRDDDEAKASAAFKKMK